MPYKIKSELALVQTALELRHWRITPVYAADKTLGRALMKIFIDRKRNAANLYIRESLKDASVKHIRELLAHELMHIVLDGMCEQYYMDRDKNTTCGRFHQEQERAVEHLAHCIANLLK